MMEDGMRVFAHALAPLSAALIVAAAGTAHADDPAPESGDDDDVAVFERGAAKLTTTPLAPLRGSEHRLGRDLAWSRLMLADDLALRATDDDDGRVPQLRDVADPRLELWTTRPDAVASAASALGSLLAGGLPMIAVRRFGAVRQRHSLRPWFRSRGVALVWRVEF
jgi:hypothetical protein